MPVRKRSRAWTTETGFRPSRTLALKKKQTRGAQRKNARVVVPRNKLGFPTSMVSTLRYTDRIDFAPTAITTLAHTFAANDVYDPNVTGVGHQPRGFDEYTLLYDTFTVTTSRMSVNWMYEGYGGPSSTGASGNMEQGIEDESNVAAVSPAICGIFKSNATYGASIDNSEQMEKDRTTWTVLNTQSSAKTTSSRSSFDEFFGKQDLVAAEGYSGTTGGFGSGTAPAEKVFYHVWASRGSDDYPAGVCKITAYITIEYRVTFTNPKPLDAS